MRGLAWLLFLGSSVHVASTGWLYTLADVRAYAAQRPLRYRWVPVGLIVAGCHDGGGRLSGAHGMAPAALFRRGSSSTSTNRTWAWPPSPRRHTGSRPLTRTERRALVVAGGAGIVGLMARPALLQLHVDAQRRVPLRRGRDRLRRSRPDGARGVEPAARVRTAPVVWARSTPWRCCSRSRSFSSASPYARGGGMTIAHGLQYLLLVGLVAGGGRPTTRLACGRRALQRRAGGRRAPERGVTPARLRCPPSDSSSGPISVPSWRTS